MDIANIPNASICSISMALEHFRSCLTSSSILMQQRQVCLPHPSTASLFGTSSDARSSTFSICELCVKTLFTLPVEKANPQSNPFDLQNGRLPFHHTFAGLTVITTERTAIRFHCFTD